MVARREVVGESVEYVPLVEVAYGVGEVYDVGGGVGERVAELHGQVSAVGADAGVFFLYG